MEKKEEMKYIREAEIIVTEIRLLEDARVKGTCKQIIMQTDKGRITFRPKEEVRATRVDETGMPIDRVEREEMLIADLPEIVFLINQKIKEKGQVAIIAKYTEWHTVDQEAKPVVYNYFASMKDFKAIEIV